jgi:hypothetical protein
MSLSQRIVDTQARITGLRDKLAEHLENLDDSNVSDKDMELSQDLNIKIAQQERTLVVLQDSERQLGDTAGKTGNGNEHRALQRVVNGNGAVHSAGNGNGATDQTRQFFSPPGSKELKPLDYLVRSGVIAYLSKVYQRNPDDMRQRITNLGFGYDDDKTKAACELVVRAATSPAMTNVTGWAAELAVQIQGDFMALLTPKSVFPRLSAMGLSLTFGRAARIAIPTRSATPSIAGSFVGEGLPIPVRQGAFTAQILTPKKMAVITTWTREIDEHSIPAIEGLLRDAIQQDTAIAIDSVLIDSNVATAVRPPGLLAGLSTLTPTAGGGLAALIGDLKSLIGAVTTSTKGNLRSPAFLMNPTDMLSVGLASAPNTGIFPFKAEIAGGTLLTIPVIDSATVPAKTVILTDAADFVSVGADTPRFEVSDQATLHEEDTTPLPIVIGGTASTPVRSLWQTDSLALRLIMPLNWTVRRAGVTTFVSGVTW